MQPPTSRLLLLAALLLSVAFGAHAQAPRILTIDIDSVVHPLTADIVDRGLRQAEESGAQAVLIRLNTPGGMLAATQQIIQSIVGSKVPVITFVTPSGGKAASAGFMILMAGDIAAMAPGTNTGAATPVLMGGGELDETMKRKVQNDAAAAMRAITDKRGRNTELAEEAVVSARSFTEEEALESNLIDVIVTENELPDALEGRLVRRFDGAEATLATAGATLQPMELSYRQRVLLPLTDPSLAFILTALGLLGIYIEFTHPGLVFPGVFGGLMAIIGLMALSLLPINWAGAALLVFGVACLIAEAFIVSHGILAAGGVVAMTLGAVMLIDTQVPELSIGWGVAMAVTVPFAVITVFLLNLAIRSFRYKVTTGEEGMIGETGVVKMAIGPDGGRVFVQGELWWADAARPIAAGAHVRVKEVRGLRLTVEALEPAGETTP
ncbi:MAG: nodulation protein NfeD [Bryobacterales bacterium]|nr:nodulation protein NfeD [Bryobacterales bacterium]